MKPFVTLEKFFPFIPMYHKKTPRCTLNAVKRWLRQGQQELKPLMPSPHKEGPRALTPQHHWDAQTVPPSRKTKCKYMPETEFSSPGKISPFRDHNENPAASGDSHVQTWTKSIRTRRQALRRRNGEAEAEKGIHRWGSKTQ